MRNNKTLSFLWLFIKKYKFSFLLTLIPVVFADLMDLVGSNLIFKNFIDKIGTNEININQSIILFILYSLSTSLLLVVIPIKEKTSFGYKFKLKEDIRNYIFNLLLKQSNKFFNNNLSGTLNSKINDITNNVGDFVDKIIDIISNSNCFIISLIIFARKSLSFAIFFFFWTVIYFSIYYLFSMKIKKQTELVSDIESKCSGKIVDCFTNILNIKNFAKERQERYNVKKHTKIILQERSKIHTIKSKLGIFNFLGKFSFSIVVAIISINMYFNGVITLGDLTFNITVSSQLFWWIKWVLQMLSDNIESYAKMKQAIETLIVEREIIDKKNAKKLDISNGKIEFKNINFKY